MPKKFETQWFYTGLDTKKEIRQGGLLGFRKEEVDVYDAKFANLDQFSQQLEAIYNEFDVRGLDVVNVVPISLGSSEPCHASTKNGQNYLGETPYSITRGAVVVGKRRDLE